MKKNFFNEDVADLLFRVFFCSIFFILGSEHLFHDELIQKLMPSWFPMKRELSISAGIILLSGGSLVLLGFKSRLGALILTVFLVLVTISVHTPALLGVGVPADLPREWTWLWDIFQRSNFVKNLCLLGVCCHLMHHKPGKFSLERYLARRES